MTTTMKTIGTLLLVAILISSNGCVTYCTVQNAKGVPTGATEPKPVKPEPHPAYYLLLPLTIPIDIVTSPIQGVFYLIYQSNVKANGGKAISTG
jgi:hypothetical protein